MFSNQAYLDKKTGPYGVGRLSYLQSLVTEFQEATSTEAKEQVLANLANFAYDPINYNYLRELNVLDLFLDCLTDPSDVIKEFAIGGLCNLCLDRTNKSYILQNGGVNLVLACLSSSNIEIVLSAITALMYLMTPESKHEIVTPPVVEAMVKFSKSSNPRVANLGTVFCQDYCTSGQMRAIDASVKTMSEVQPVVSAYTSTTDQSTLDDT